MSIILMSLISTVFYIGNQWVSVGVTDETATVRAGSVTSLYDYSTQKYIAQNTGQFSGINSGSFIPATGEITLLNDTTLVFHTDHLTDGSSSLPLDLTVTYTVVERGLEMSYRIEYLEDIEFWNPLEIDFHLAPWDNIVVSNQTTIDEEFSLDGSTGFQRFSGDQLFRLASTEDIPDALFILPNTSKGLVVINDDGNPYMSVRVLDTEEPRETAVGPVLHSIIPSGQIDEYFVRYSMDEFFAPIFLGGHPEGAERSAAWMLDELSFVHPNQGDLWGFSETSSGPEGVSAGLISLLEGHPEMKMNWLLLPDGILTGNRDSVWFEPGYEDSWSHWHGTWRFSTEAPADYLQWLINIQNNVYPWADRVRMGTHGYHHTPNPDSSFGQFHEFITYELEEHQERFRMNFLDLDACGLDTNMVKVLRFPGHRSSLSGIQAIIDHGIKFFCNGWRLTDWYAGKQFRNQWISRFQTVNGRMWGSNSVWWGDYYMMYPTYYLSDVMEKGKFGLLGCHPIAMLEGWGAAWNPIAYARVDSLLYSIEDDYDNFIWLFPEEYGNYLEDCFNIRVNTIRSLGSELELSFSGSVPDGLTFCASLHPDDIVNYVSLDGNSIPWDLRSEGRLFAVSSALSYGEHELLIGIDPMGVENNNSYADQIFVALQNPSNSRQIEVFVEGIAFGTVFNLSMYDLTGREITSSSQSYNGSSYSLDFNDPIPQGMYVVVVEAGNIITAEKTVVVFD